MGEMSLDFSGGKVSQSGGGSGIEVSKKILRPYEKRNTVLFFPVVFNTKKLPLGNLEARKF